MNPRRRTTVHDLAALRLHRDGTRVANSDSNSSSRRAKYTIRDARGNWVAKDAGGLGTVKLRPAASQPEGEQDDDGGESELEVDGELMKEEGVLPKPDKGKGRARESGDEEEIAVNTRAGKRRRFDEDFSYLDPVTPHIPGGEDPHSHPAEADPGTFPVPSADLLKCLHYFATAYYTAMGQLYDASRESRKERKIRRGQKFKKTEAAGSSPLSVGKELDDAQGSSDEEDIEFEEDEEGEEDQEIAKDMYKLFDGSALMALGMLFQEHVAGLLEPNVPEGWDQEFALAERDRSAAEKRARRARQMWNQRHTVKGEGSEQPETESGGEGGEERSQVQEGIAVSDSDSSDSAADE
ncbi:hypothetical protein GSI_01308 [Ganoderma sinense ZZ0214-1]|uniref:Uncharacterized protein n=1 Tax=Ganoderma sinense ZZ0214-1 TaxID=1077348 RepID=A0A2G8SV31_9APHY|nr:hypothetical protein GSI_01308 [Ganoderma sinense ZZ0214-1]